MSGTVRPDVLNELTPVDLAVFADAWTLPDDPDVRTELVREALEHHLKECAPYREFAERREFALGDLRGPVDLARVPQIPVVAFKHTLSLLSCSSALVAKRCTSSGTMGRLSEVQRDRPTIERLLGSVRWGVELIGNWEDDEVAVLNLGPGQHEAGDLWFAYVTSLVELVYPTVHAVRDGRFDAKEAGRTLRELEEQFPVVLLLGPPPLVLKVLRAVAGQRPESTASTYVVTAGGWKRSTGEVLDRPEFEELARSSLNLVDSRQIRDAFNQVELNTVLIECESHRKHVPPWLEVIVRNPRTLEPVPSGTGLLSYLDPSASSYPCFFISDDFGRLDVETCPCGRTGRTLTVERRVKRDEEWGCARKMDRDYVHEEDRK